MNNVNYKELLQVTDPLLAGIDNEISLLANASALLNSYLENVNWCGFYLNVNGTLKLGPFQGKVACVTIPFNRGVCGACATSKTTILVDDVHKFEGHIACDSASNSEIVIPIIVNNELYGVLDIDSVEFSNFNENDKVNLENFVEILEQNLTKLNKEH